MKRTDLKTVAGWRYSYHTNAEKIAKILVRENGCKVCAHQFGKSEAK